MCTLRSPRLPPLTCPPTEDDDLHESTRHPKRINSKTKPRLRCAWPHLAQEQKRWLSDVADFRLLPDMSKLCSEASLPAIWIPCFFVYFGHCCSHSHCRKLMLVHSAVAAFYYSNPVPTTCLAAILKFTSAPQWLHHFTSWENRVLPASHQETIFPVHHLCLPNTGSIQP